MFIWAHLESLKVNIVSSHGQFKSILELLYTIDMQKITNINWVVTEILQKIHILNWSLDTVYCVKKSE